MSHTTCIFRERQKKSQENVIQRHSKEEKLKDGFEIECYKILKYQSEKINPSPLFWDLRLFSENQAWLAGKELVRGNLDPRNTQVWPLWSTQSLSSPTFLGAQNLTLVLARSQPKPRTRNPRTPMCFLQAFPFLRRKRAWERESQPLENYLRPICWELLCSARQKPQTIFFPHRSVFRDFSSLPLPNQIFWVHFF